MKYELAVVAVLCLFLTASVFAAFVPALPRPTGFTAHLSGCDKVTVSWDAINMSAGYRLVIVNNGNGTSSTIQVLGTSILVDWLDPGSYSFRVQAIGIPNVSNNSGFTDPISVNLEGCVVCAAPVVSLTSVSPTLLWPPNGRQVTVFISGMVTTLCPLVNSGLTLQDEYGSDQSGTINVGENGGFFSGTVIVEASRRGNDRDGRLYNVSAYAQNASGRGESSALSIVVPHDQGH